MKYSPAFQRQLEYAAYDCAQRGGRAIADDHLLLGLYRENFPLVDEVFSTFRVDSLKVLERLLEAHPEAGATRSADAVSMGPEALGAIACAEREACRLGHRELTPPHTLLGILGHERDRLQRYFIRAELVHNRADQILAEVRELVSWLRFEAARGAERELEVISRGTIVGVESMRLKGSRKPRGYAVQVRLFKRF